MLLFLIDLVYLMANANEEQDVLKDLENGFTPEMGEAVTNKVPEGTGVAKIENAFLNRSKGESGRKQLNIQWAILEHKEKPGAAGKMALNRMGLENVQDIERVNTLLVNLALSPIKASNGPDFAAQVSRACRELQGICANVRIVVKDPQYDPNIYVNPGQRRKDLEGPGGGSAPVQTGAKKERF